MFGMDKKARFIRALKIGQLETVKKILGKNPGYLGETFLWGGNKNVNFSGTALHCAAFYNHPAIVEFLVREKGIPVIAHSKANWTPLHHACKANAYEAAHKLLELGADPLREDARGGMPHAITTEKRIKNLFHPIFEAQAQEKARAREKEEREKQRQREESENRARAEEDAKKAGHWTLVSPVEVAFERTISLPRNKKDFSLTELFNFETRRWTCITESHNGTMAQTVTLFDDMSDKEMLRQALAQLASLGGKADPDIIDRRPIEKPKPFGSP
jgi:hypothetical protein